MSNSGGPAPPVSPQAAAPSAPPPANPGLSRINALAAKITSTHPGAKVEWVKPHRLKVSVPPGALREVALFARDSLGFDHISTVSGVDWIAKNSLEVVYFVGSTAPGQEALVLALSERVPRESPVVTSMVEVWKGAEYHERETHEMFGINFQGHPDQSHLFLPEDWDDLPPLRKDYVSPGR